MKPLLEKLKQNKTEAAYDEYLRFRKIAGEIEDYKWEPVSLILRHAIPGRAKGMRYKPDFLVVFVDRFEFHEVKGFWRPQDKNRVKAAAELFPWFKFVAVMRGDNRICEWEFEEF